MSKVLMDTNILVYAKDIESKYHAPSLQFFNSDHELYVTSKNLTEYYAVVTKGISPLLNPHDALQDLDEFLSYCTVLYPSAGSYRKLRELILNCEPKGILIHDMEIAAIALANGITKIATFNGIDFQKVVEIEVFTPWTTGS